MSADRSKSSPLKLKSTRFAIEPIVEKDQATIAAIKKMKKEKIKAEKQKKEMEQAQKERMEEHANRIRETKLKIDESKAPKTFKLRPLKKILYQYIPTNNPHSYEKNPLEKPPAA